MQEVKILRLTTGEDVIAKVEQGSGDLVTLNKPFVISGTALIQSLTCPGNFKWSGCSDIPAVNDGTVCLIFAII